MTSGSSLVQYIHVLGECPYQDAQPGVVRSQAQGRCGQLSILSVFLVRQVQREAIADNNTVPVLNATTSSLNQINVRTVSAIILTVHRYI